MMMIIKEGLLEKIRGGGVLLFIIMSVGRLNNIERI